MRRLQVLALFSLGVFGSSLTAVCQDLSSLPLVQVQAMAGKGDAAAESELSARYVAGKDMPQDIAKAAEWGRKAAEQGNAWAEYLMGQLYLFGADKAGIAKDPKVGLEWLMKSAAQNQPLAEESLGSVYLWGNGADKDPAKGLEWYQRAAKDGNGVAMNEIGDMYDSGNGVGKDQVQSANWYRQAAEKGDATGERNLAYAYEKGLGLAKDQAQAIAWYQKAADGGDMVAENNLAQIYEFGHGVGMDRVKAVELYRKAAAQGNAGAKNNLGYDEMMGRGIDAPNRAEAKKLFEEAAAAGSNGAKKNLADLGRVDGFRHGSSDADFDWVTDHPYNNPASYKYKPGNLEKMAEKGDRDAAFALGQGYISGMFENGGFAKGGGLVAPNIPMANQWLNKAVELGYKDGRGENFVGVKFETAHDPADALKWLELAATNGSAGAIARLRQSYPSTKLDLTAMTRRLAEDGDHQAQLQMGTLMVEGAGGLAKNPEAAGRWFAEADWDTAHDEYVIGKAYETAGDRKQAVYFFTQATQRPAEYSKILGVATTSYQQDSYTELAKLCPECQANDATFLAAKQQLANQDEAALHPVPVSAPPQQSGAASFLNGLSAALAGATQQASQPNPIQDALNQGLERTRQIAAQGRVQQPVAPRVAAPVVPVAPQVAAPVQVAAAPQVSAPVMTVAQAAAPAAAATDGGTMMACPANGHITKGHYAACDVYSGQDYGCTPGQMVSTWDGVANAPGCSVGGAGQGAGSGSGGTVSASNGGGAGAGFAGANGGGDASIVAKLVPPGCTAVNDKWVWSAEMNWSSMELVSLCSGDVSVTWFYNHGTGNAASIPGFGTITTGGTLLPGKTMKVSIYTCPIDHPWPKRLNGDDVDGPDEPYKCAPGVVPSYGEQVKAGTN